MYYKKCFYPECNNDTTNSPDKIFTRLREDTREEQCNDAKISYHKVYAEYCKEIRPGIMAQIEENNKNTKYCCEDHFDPKEDLWNYSNFKLNKEQPVLKPNAMLKLQNKLHAEITDPKTKEIIQPILYCMDINQPSKPKEDLKTYSKKILTKEVILPNTPGTTKTDPNQNELEIPTFNIPAPRAHAVQSPQPKQDLSMPIIYIIPGQINTVHLPNKIALPRLTENRQKGTTLPRLNKNKEIDNSLPRSSEKKVMNNTLSTVDSSKEVKVVTEEKKIEQNAVRNQALNAYESLYLFGNEESVLKGNDVPFEEKLEGRYENNMDKCFDGTILREILSGCDAQTSEHSDKPHEPEAPQTLKPDPKAVSKEVISSPPLLEKRIEDMYKDIKQHIQYAIIRHVYNYLVREYDVLSPYLSEPASSVLSDVLGRAAAAADVSVDTVLLAVGCKQGGTVGVGSQVLANPKVVKQNHDYHNRFKKCDESILLKDSEEPTVTCKLFDDLPVQRPIYSEDEGELVLKCEVLDEDLMVAVEENIMNTAKQKPSDAVLKPSDDVPKIPADMSKISKDMSETSVDVLKPTEDMANPSDDVSKPSDYVSKIADGLSKRSDAVSNPSGDSHQRRGKHSSSDEHTPPHCSAKRRRLTFERTEEQCEKRSSAEPFSPSLIDVEVKTEPIENIIPQESSADPVLTSDDEVKTEPGEDTSQVTSADACSSLLISDDELKTEPVEDLTPQLRTYMHRILASPSPEFNPKPTVKGSEDGSTGSRDSKPPDDGMQIDPIREILPQPREKSTPFIPPCRHMGTDDFKCGALTKEDTQFFHDQLHSKTEKGAQENFILQHVLFLPLTKKKEGQIIREYYIPTLEGVLVKVCMLTFCYVLQLKHAHVYKTTAQYASNGQDPLVPLQPYNDFLKTFHAKKESVRKFLIEHLPFVTIDSKLKIERPKGPRRKLGSLFKIYEETPNKFSITETFFRQVYDTYFDNDFELAKAKCDECSNFLKEMKKRNCEVQKSLLNRLYKRHRLKAICFFDELKKFYVGDFW